MKSGRARDAKRYNIIDTRDLGAALQRTDRYIKAQPTERTVTTLRACEPVTFAHATHTEAVKVRGVKRKGPGSLFFRGLPWLRGPATLCRRTLPLSASASTGSSLGRLDSLRARRTVLSRVYVFATACRGRHRPAWRRCRRRDSPSSGRRGSWCAAGRQRRHRVSFPVP